MKKVYIVLCTTTVEHDDGTMELGMPKIIMVFEKKKAALQFLEASHVNTTAVTFDGRLRYSTDIGLYSDVYGGKVNYAYSVVRSSVIS